MLHWVSMYALAYQPISSRELNWLVIFGIAVAKMVLSFEREANESAIYR
jgi:hypothetical protein